MTDLSTRRLGHGDPATTKAKVGMYNQVAVGLDGI